MTAQPNGDCPIETKHTFRIDNSTTFSLPGDLAVDLIVTSPPYPMIAMWDSLFAGQSEEVANALIAKRFNDAFESMHGVLDQVWTGCHRTLREGGFLCINIGDAVRTCDGTFRMFSNFARVIRSLNRLGFTLLPSIIWRKPANSPTKFLGSGVLPAGAYVTLEHEHILVCRKGEHSRVTAEEKAARRRSAIFWEERNSWFSDLWSFTGVKQDLPNQMRSRSAAFPLELPFRLICMYSLIGDTVCDPFSGTGTTTLAAMAAGRNSIGIETDAGLARSARARALDPVVINMLRNRGTQRITEHRSFLAQRKAPPKHHHHLAGVDVVSSQETDLCVPVLQEASASDDEVICTYVSDPWST
jgi:DNA modification methylase